MNIFDLRQALINDYSSYVKSFIEVRDQRIQGYVEEQLFQNGLLWPEPLIQMNPRFEAGLSIDELVDRATLHPACREIFRRGKDSQHPTGVPMSLYKHQQQAVELAQKSHSYVLTTGTGSGKSLAYIVPIVDSILRNPGEPGIKAIVVYPMNALANSQEGELKKYLTLNYPVGERPVTFRRYTGQESQPQRDEILDNPPDILLTNYVMLELILTRKREQPLLEKTRLRFLVLDELHTYRGRQGADVALLVRRVRNRLTPKGTTLQCVGTSATLASGGTRQEQRKEVARMATLLFGCNVSPDHVIGESLTRVTPEVDENAPTFRQNLAERVRGFDAHHTTSIEDFSGDTLAVWLESIFGVTRQEGRLVRSTPRRIDGTPESAAWLLQQTTESSAMASVPKTRYAEVIKQGLLAGYEQGVFAFRLHQFISKGDTVYATLEAPDQRHITLQPQMYAPGGRKRHLFPLVFCRECGQEYYVVRWKDEATLVTRDVQDLLHEAPPEEGKIPASQRLTGRPGYVYIDSDDGWPRDREGIEGKLPEEWGETVNGKARLTSTGRKHRPLPLFFHPDGTVDEDETSGTPCFFLPASFLFCMHCGVTYSAHLRSDFEKLSELSSEGRSTATTVLSLSTIRHLREARRRGEGQTILPKMLSFTDNRQDASLQAGHFNDFIEIGLLRSALYRAVLQSGESGIHHEELARKVFEALGLQTRDFAINPEAKFQAKVQAERALREVLGYRLYLDLRRGWRITSPNLEQCGLLEIAYQDLDLICEDQPTWEADSKGVRRHIFLAQMPVDLRKDLCKVLLDFMRRELAIKVVYLEAAYNESIKLQSSQHLKDPWAIDEDEDLVHAGCLFPRSRGEGADRGYVYLSARGRYGRYLRLALKKAGFAASLEDIQQVICDQLAALAEVGLIEETIPKRHKGDVAGYQLLAASLIWRQAPTEASYHDPLRMPNLPENQPKRVNQFFMDFYQEHAAHLERIQHLRAAEHTAQVPNERREEREQAFRLDEKDERFLPILYCSPTMELGVDIAELNVVNMRNIPPTPASYAQRSGRAGRGGQPALVFAYCSTGSSHDQYFFQHPGAMVSGSVAPPRLDLANEDLLRAHVYAIWLAESSLALGNTLSDLLEIEGTTPTLLLKPEILIALRDPSARQRAERRARNILLTIMEQLEEGSVRWYTSNWLAETLNNVEQSFDRACWRWRELYRAAQDQRDTQHAVTLDASRDPNDREKAKRLRGEAEEQLKLLTASSSSDSEKKEFSEFYSYRYFASEGFLPGYNFPRLPLSAYIPARRARRQDEYLSRPRFLAISEFAPRAIIYHEGSRYVINRSLLRRREDRSGILTRSAKQCQHCGYLHPVTGESSLDICRLCHRSLDHPLERLFRLENVSTRRKDKINSDEEERQRQGYEIRTAVSFPPRKDGRPDYELALVVDKQGETVARLIYGQAATLWRINFGPLRRERKEEYGFVLDTERGYWARDNESADDKEDPLSHSRTRVVPYVEDTRNCLLFEPAEEWSLEKMASLQAALKSALQVQYHLEDNELAAEPLPDRQRRTSLLFYEATEGGAGVLRQLTEERTALADVAKVALHLCHFEPETLEDLRKAPGALETCEAACYHCLMTYANQRDHEMLDRKSIKDKLAQLANCSVTWREPLPLTVPLTIERVLVDSDEDMVQEGVTQVLSEIEIDFLNELTTRGLMGPLEAHSTVGASGAQPDFCFPNQVVVYVDGADGLRQARDQDLVSQLENDGYMVIRFAARADWQSLFVDYAEMFRRHA